jgi:hypothetical protein
VCVRVRRLDGCSDDLDAVAFEEGVEGARELCVAVVDKNRTRWSRSSNSIRRFRACCSIHAVSGLLVSAKYSMRRLPMERKAST